MHSPRVSQSSEPVENHTDERKASVSEDEDDKIPSKFDGYLMKKRKWPLKGWHKRFFLLERGQLKYAKTPTAVQDEDTLHGSIDLGSSAMATKRGVFKIDLDTEDSIYHLKCKSGREFESWTKALRQHRGYRQNLAPLTGSFSFDNNTTTLPSSPTRERQSLTNMMVTPSRAVMDGRSLSLSLKRERFRSLHQATSVMMNPVLMTSRVSAWLVDNSVQESTNKELMSVQEHLFKLTQLLQNIRLNTPMADEISKKSSKKKQRSNHKRKKSDEVKNVTQDLRSGHPAWTGGTSSSDNGGIYSRDTPFPEISEEDPFDEFIMYSFKVVNNMKSLLLSISTERDRLKEAQTEFNRTNSNTYINQLLSSNQLLMQQNRDMRARLSKITKEADLSSVPEPPPVEETPTLMRTQASNDSYLSIAESCSEFYDAEEYFLSSSSSSESDDKSDTESETSDNVLHGSSETLQNITGIDEMEDEMDIFTKSQTGRRSCLPAPSADISDINMWNILRKNVGKDLSKVTMPVVLNEPLGMLQRLCEELEYSELLDKAAETLDPFERMVHVAAFAVSAYSSLYYRASRKPFNPVLGESFECVREDKGFKFVSEQVSHHPPVSACHCDSRNFVFWQSCRMKNKFWGRSMEVLPLGTVNVVLPRFNEHYRWNKVTSSIHNVLGGNRWLENYGEMAIRTAAVSCKIKFVKAGYWSSKLHEFHGCVMDEFGEVRHQLFGKWNEGMYCGVPPSARLIWRPGSMPDDHELFYSFTRFAVELNELKVLLKPLLPPTDTRFRTDQRALEEGLISLAETEKQKVEDRQRNDKKEREEVGVEYTPRFFSKEDEESWVSNNTYWDLRRTPGFVELKNPELW